MPMLNALSIPSPPKPHLRTGKLPQPPQEALVLNPRRTPPTVPTPRIAHAKDLRQTDLPGRVAVEARVGTEDD